MTRETCELFTHEVMPTGRTPLGNGSERIPIPPTKQVLYAFLWSMANQEPTRAVATRFDVALSSADWVLKGCWSIRSIHPMAYGECQWQNITTKGQTFWVAGVAAMLIMSISGLGETGPEQEWSNGTEFSGYSHFPENWVSSKGSPKFLEILPGIFTVPLDFWPEISEILNEWKAPVVSYDFYEWCIFQ